MTPDEFVEYLRTVETPDNNSFNFYRHGYRDPEEAAITSQNLLNYLRIMQDLHPTILLVGEAPGYKGCKLSGIPFTSEYHIIHEDFFKDGFKVLDIDNVDKEVSASVIWNVIRHKNVMPLMWNIYPFHPLKENGGNGKPKSKDIRLGRSILDSLLTMFDIKDIYCIGTTSRDALNNHPLYRGYIRHPSHGGKNECTRRLNEILECVYF